MLAKLLTLLTASKAATVATVVVLGAATVTVGVQSPVVQDAVQQAVQTVTGQGATGDQARTRGGDCDHGQPAVVAQRNAADKLLRAAFQEDQKALEDLRGKGVDNKAAGDIIKAADGKLKETLDAALDQIGAQTLGRDGQNKPSGSPSAKPSASASPSASPSPCPSESPKASGSPAPKASESPKPSGSAKPSQEGRVTVAERTTLDGANQAVVDKAIADMAAIVKDAQAKVGALPTPDHGKPSGEPGNKSSEKPGDGGKPSNVPGGRPSESPHP